MYVIINCTLFTRLFRFFADLHDYHLDFIFNSFHHLSLLFHFAPYYIFMKEIQEKFLTFVGQKNITFGLKI